MTVKNQTPFQSFTANGTQTTFSFSFYVESKGNIEVQKNKKVVSATDFSYDKVSNSVVFTSIPKKGDLIEIKRVTSLDRSIQYETSNNSFRPETLNKDIDRLWHSLQESNYADIKRQESADYAVEVADKAKQDSSYAVNTANAAKATADGIDGKVNTANTTANTAKAIAEGIDAKATQALNTANGIDAKATNALNTANGIDAKATQAINTANGIDAKATQALNTANGINAKVNQANTTANAASVTANGIDAKVNQANATANTAKTTADTAIITANNAKSTADGINAKATQAQKDSAAALSTANSLDAKINTANTNATSAINTANSAKTTADTATTAVQSKQDKLIAGNNITITGNKIASSAEDFRTWVAFDGSDGSIKASVNVLSITLLGRDVYQINYKTSLPNNKYAVFVSCAWVKVGQEPYTQTAYIPISEYGQPEVSTTSIQVGLTEVYVGGRNHYSRHISVGVI